MLENENYYQAQYWDEIIGSWQDIPDGEARSQNEALSKAMKFRQAGMDDYGVNYVISVVHHTREVYFAQ